VRQKLHVVCAHILTILNYIYIYKIAAYVVKLILYVKKTGPLVQMHTEQSSDNFRCISFFVNKGNAKVESVYVKTIILNLRSDND
jgi:hypothetical protein